jgi:hypothetical protein
MCARECTINRRPVCYGRLSGRSLWMGRTTIVVVDGLGISEYEIDGGANGF